MINKLLLIDDDIDDQEIFRLALQQTFPAITCECTDSGPEALRKLMSDEYIRPELIFIDMNMHCLDGIECLRRLRNINHLNEVPIYLYSTTVDPGLTKKAIKLGAIDFLKKSTFFEDICMMISNVINSLPRKPG